MAEYGDEVRQEYGEGDDSLEETTAANAGANNSIIGKMRSSVTSILPNSLSKWFSPSSNNNNDSANGSYNSIKRNRTENEANTPHARIDRRNEMARRRIEINDYAEEDDDDGDDDEEGNGDELEDDEVAEESNHSDDVQISSKSASVQRRRHLSLISPIEADQPPSKRSRMTLDGTMISSRPLTASTPAINTPRNSGVVNNHYGHLNLYSGVNRKELGYNFYTSVSSANNFEQQNMAPDIIDLIPIPISSSGNDILNVSKGNPHMDNETTRSRRFLNIPPTGTSSLGSNYSGNVLPTLKRQSLNSVKANNSTAGSRQNADIQNYDNKNEPVVLHPTLELDEVLLETQKYNGRNEPKFQNGAAEFDEELRHRSVTDSEAEDIDTITELPTNTSIHSTLKAGMASQRAASSGLFNMSSGNSRSGSRTSSFGNGLNFYTHLEGRKSLFAGNSHGTRTHTGNPLNSSTLSLNSLSRRQFNASIYGSTSALSDSRLLNTSSPFYKGNTTYGGAAAYSKYATSLGSNSRLTPTLIRPTSSLSTLSSSSNSIAAGAGISTAHGEQNPAISGTAKTILDLLNGFTTPLSEAKKMASSLRQQPVSSSLQNTKSKRLSDADLHASRAMRLQQVRTPYMRPAVMLQPKKSANETQIPPVRELQVPSMSQLLQMKKLQTLTERSRQITMQKSSNQECTGPILSKTIEPIAALVEAQKPATYSLPTKSNIEQHTETSVFDSLRSDCKQQKHVNKIKHKIANPLRTPDIPDETPPAPANLPNIAFPLMAQMPKIDIPLPKTNQNCNTKTLKKVSPKTNAVPSIEAEAKQITHNFKFSPPVDLQVMPSSMHGIEPSNMNFKFSKPAPLEASNAGITVSKSPKQPENVSVLKSPPALPSALFALPKQTPPTAVPTLKTGSVLDALKKPFVLPKTSSNEATSSINTQPISSFGSQFKKAANEWECDTCMIRNKESAQKCVACDVPRKGGKASTDIPQKPITTVAPIIPIAAGFGNQFKKQSGEWECEACMVRNKPELSKCVSCETARKTDAKSSSQTDAPKSYGQSIFGNSVKSFSSPPAAVTSDSGFKSLAAAQQASKWECEACMTRNESSRSKCACCEQPKPGTESQKENAPSFNFGATAASKFSFGFNAGAPDPAKEKDPNQKILESSVNISASADKPAKGFTFGTGTAVTTTQSNSFSFGFQTKPTTTPEKAVVTSGKDTSDSSSKAPGFSFGLASSASSKANTTLTFSATTPKIELKATSTATSTTTVSTITTTVMTTTASSTPPKVAFNFGSASTTTIQSASPLATTKPHEGFAFSSQGFQSPATSSSATTITTTSNNSTNKLSFPATAITTAAGIAATTAGSSTATSNVSGTAVTASPAFKFGVISTSATSTTTTKPMFSFGAPSVPATSIGGSVSSSTVTTSTTGSTSTNSTTIKAGPVGFGFTNSTPSVPVPATTAATNSPFSINQNTNVNTSSNLSTFAAFSGPKSSPQTAITAATTTAPPAFGGFSFGGGITTSTKSDSGNLFGTLAPKTQGEIKPIASAVPIFGNAASQAEPKTTTSNSWPKNTFLFGSPANTAATKIGADASTEPASKAVFGSLKAQAIEPTTATNNLNATSTIFGSVGGSSSTSSFGNSATPMFGANSAPAPTNATNLFGSNSNNTTAPQFGSIGSGQTTLGNNSTANASPSFGNTTAVGFGSFGAAAVTTTPSSITNSEANTQPAATPFAFGAPQPQPTNSGFNFGATAATSRPVFNFTSTNQPTFNFTGSSTESTQNSTRPFQFGATAAAAPSFAASSGFGFGGAPLTETTSNAPFQFSAGSSTATSNIFAPSPSASTTTQAARRKVRIPNRRLPPR